MNNKVLSNEERRERLKVELEKTKVRVQKANDKFVDAEKQLKTVRNELDNLNDSKLIMESKADNNALSFAQVMICLSILLISFPILIFTINLGVKNFITIFYYWLATFLNISIIVNWNDLVHKILPKFEKIAIKKLTKSKKYRDLLEKINNFEIKFKYDNIEYKKALASYNEALNARNSLEHKIFNFYNTDYNYKYVNDRKISYAKSKPLSSKKNKNKIRKLKDN